MKAETYFQQVLTQTYKVIKEHGLQDDTSQKLKNCANIAEELNLVKKEIEPHCDQEELPQ